MKKFLVVYCEVFTEVFQLLFFKVFSVAGRNEIKSFHLDHLTTNIEEKPWYSTKQISEFIEDETNLDIIECKVKDGNVALVEILVINLLVKKFNPQAFFEIGTFDGRTTLNVAKNSSPSCKIYTLDLPKSRIDSTQLEVHSWERTYIDKEISGERFSSITPNNDTHKITQLYGDSANFDFKPFAGKIDFAFIDGSHAYDYVISDTKNMLKIMEGTKGVILWHDFHDDAWHAEVIRALGDMRAEYKCLENVCRIAGTSLAILELS